METIIKNKLILLHYKIEFYSIIYIEELDFNFFPFYSVINVKNIEDFYKIY